MENSIADTMQVFILVLAVSLNLLLIFAVYKSDTKSTTNRLYFLLGIVMSAWLVINYISLKPDSLEYSLLWIRMSIFLAAPMTSLFFLLASTFPSSRLQITRKTLYLIVAVTLLTMALNVSPYAFTSLDMSSSVPRPLAGPGILPFSIISTFFSLASIYILAKKYRSSEDRILSSQLRLMIFGILTMLSLVIITVFIPVILGYTSIFVAFIPLYSLIFLGSTAYAIAKHHLFSIKVIATQALTVVLWIVLLSRIFTAGSFASQIVDLLILIITVFFGILIIRSVVKEVEQRKQLQVLTKQLEGANTKLKQADQIKSQFLSFASHQVKSPMTVIKGYTTLILDGSYGEASPKIKETATKIKDSASRLILLVNDLLDLRKLEEGKIEYKKEHMDLNALVKAMFDEYTELAREKGLEFRLEAEDKPVMINGDESKIRQVFQNIIDNSLKYTETGWIKITLKDHPDAILFSVSDSGMGIDASIIDSLFEQFQRGSKEAKKIQGTGLGLFIAKQFMTAHNGTIKAESPGKGKGSTFTAKFIKKPAVPTKHV